MEGEASKKQYKLVQYNDTIYEIPIRNIDQENVILLSDVQSLLPNATALLSNSKLIPFQLDPAQHIELLPKRIPVHNLNDENIVWEVHIPNDYSNNLIQSNIEMQIKIDQLSEKLDYLLSLHQADEESLSNNDNNNNGSSNDIETRQTEITSNTRIDTSCSTNDALFRANSPPPAFSSTSHHLLSSSLPSSSSSSSILQDRSRHHKTQQVQTQQQQSQQPQQQQHEAPPSYEISILSTIKDINSKLRMFESHIPNRHKSPRWLAKRDEWVSREPDSIEQVAYQLVQLEMALLWTAVTESWIQERETWLTLVASARSERHLAGAIINLERHTLVMDDEWAQFRERWINELLEVVVLPLSHG